MENKQVNIIKKPKLTIFGSCRQHSLYKNYEITTIQEQLSYPHYTKEIIELINFCKNNHLTTEQTLYTFRTAILNKSPIIYTNVLKNEFINTDIFIIEVASKITYEYNNIYLHHISTEAKYNTSIQNKIIQRIQTKDEIEQDILVIINILKKPVIIVSHIVTYNHGERFILSEWLEEICNKYNIIFINPIKEFVKRNIHINDLLVKEREMAHYTENGHTVISTIYKEFIDKIILN